MNRLIIERQFPYYKTLCESHTPYDYPFNATQYACVDVDDEELCMLMLTLRITTCHPSTADGLNKQLPNLPTYVVKNATKSPAWLV
jgi:hypothetical protein